MNNDNKLPLRQLVIRNTYAGMIWQIYHVHSREEASLLALNAQKNGFGSQILEAECTHEETWPDWRETSADYMPKNITPLPATGYPYHYRFEGFHFPAPVEVSGETQ